MAPIELLEAIVIPVSVGSTESKRTEVPSLVDDWFARVFPALSLIFDIRKAIAPWVSPLCMVRATE